MRRNESQRSAKADWNYRDLQGGAIQTAQEIFPNHVLGIVSLEPEWTDDPA